MKAHRSKAAALAVLATAQLVIALDYSIVNVALPDIGGALLFPATLSLVNTIFDQGRERTRAIAVWGSAGAGGLSLGVLAGGVLTGLFGWPAVFSVNVPITAALLVLAPLGGTGAGLAGQPAGVMTGALHATFAAQAGIAVLGAAVALLVIGGPRPRRRRVERDPRTERELARQAA
jgi:MFS family permease